MDLERLFYPESVAVVGASPNPRGGKLPYFQFLQWSGYKGRLYAINPSYAEIEGRKSYPSIDALPEPVDLVIVSISAAHAIETVLSAARRGVKYMHFFTSGFSEVGDTKLERDLVEAAAGMTRIVGPNCIGVHCTESRLVFDPIFKQEGIGNASFLGQSGGITTNFLRMGQARQIAINKIVSYGNQADLRVEDYLEYLKDDGNISVISAYVEDVKNGRRFLDVLKQATRKKAVILLKGGSTAPGAKAAASHTGALAGGSEIWSAAMRQAGCIQAATFEHLMDCVMLAVSNKRPGGWRLGFLGAGGGTSVLFTDLASSNDLLLPELDSKTQEKIALMIKNVNTSTTNPVDLGFFGFDFDIMAKTMKAMDEDDNIDVIIPYINIDFLSTYQSDQIESGPHVLVEAASRIKKPIIPILSRFTEDELPIEEVRMKIFKTFRDAGMPVFNTIQDCIHALAATLPWSARFGEREPR